MWHLEREIPITGTYKQKELTSAGIGRIAAYTNGVPAGFSPGLTS